MRVVETRKPNNITNDSPLPAFRISTGCGLRVSQIITIKNLSHPTFRILWDDFFLFHLTVKFLIPHFAGCGMQNRKSIPNKTYFLHLKNIQIKHGYLGILAKLESPKSQKNVMEANMN